MRPHSTTSTVRNRNSLSSFAQPERSCVESLIPKVASAQNVDSMAAQQHMNSTATACEFRSRVPIRLRFAALRSLVRVQGGLHT